MAEHESSLCAPSAEFPPSIVSCLLRLFYLGERGFGCDGGSAGEVVAVVVMVAAGEGMGMEVRESGGGG